MKNFLDMISDVFNNKPAANDASSVSEAEIRRAIRELKAMNDRELNDLGLARGEIEHAVRYGRDGIDNNPKAA
ncbi:MAG: hypothetical protein CR991_06785 [Proteobacteria bacterium]|nr:MAG: hypothetical protein CR991_06785 [Pseudomonadota bacterium]